MATKYPSYTNLGFSRLPIEYVEGHYVRANRVTLTPLPLAMISNGDLNIYMTIESCMKHGPV